MGGFADLCVLFGFEAADEVLDLAGTVSMPCSGDERAVVDYLSQWVMRAD